MAGCVCLGRVNWRLSFAEKSDENIKIAAIFKTNLKQITITLLAVTFLSFSMLYIGMGNPMDGIVDSLEYQDIGQSEILKQQYGLDKPFIIQYFIWLKNILTGDWGKSYTEGQPVLTIIIERIPATLALTVPSVVLGFSIALVLGVFAAIYANTLFDYAVHWLTFILWSTPAFLFSILLLQILSLQLNLLPSGGMSRLGQSFSFFESWIYMVMPVGILALYYAVSLIGIVRSQMYAVLKEDYILTAYACGIAKWRIIFLYALKNALLPLITAAAMSIPRFFTGAFVIESIFAWPGMGRLVIESAFKKDYPVLLAEILIISAIVVISNISSDLLYKAADPRIRYAGEKE